MLKKYFPNYFDITSDWNKYVSLPNMAMTMSSFNISIDPLDTKYRASNISPLWTKVSPGGTWVVLNFIDKALKQPGLAPEIYRYTQYVTSVISAKKGFIRHRHQLSVQFTPCQETHSHYCHWIFQHCGSFPTNLGKK